jgi:20S proteasome alpha/beta subunit
MGRTHRCALRGLSKTLALLLILERIVASSSSSSSLPPWQSGSSTTTDLGTTKSDHWPLTTFGPDGRLFQVEAALRAVHEPTNPASNLVVAIQYSQGVVVVTSCPESPYMYPPDVVTNATTTSTPCSLSVLSPKESPLFTQLDHRHVWGTTAGHLVDGQVLRQNMRAASDQVRRRRGTPTRRPAFLARLLADAAQATTQKAGNNDSRLLKCAALVVDSNEIWRVDANGQFWKCRATVVGRGATPRVEQDLLERLDGGTNITSSLELRLMNLTRDEALAIATRTIRGTFRARRALERATSDVTDDDDHDSGVQLQGMVFDNAVGHAQVVSHSNLTSLCRPPNSTTA